MRFSLVILTFVAALTAAAPSASPGAKLEENISPRCKGWTTEDPNCNKVAQNISPRLLRYGNPDNDPLAPLKRK
jgi:hypothetical protein